MTRNTYYKVQCLSSIQVGVYLLRMSDYWTYDWSTNNFTQAPIKPFFPLFLNSFIYPGPVQLYTLKFSTVNMVDGNYFLIYCDSSGNILNTYGIEFFTLYLNSPDAVL